MRGGERLACPPWRGRSRLRGAWLCQVPWGSTGPGRAAGTGDGVSRVGSRLALQPGRWQTSSLGWNWEMLIRFFIWYGENRPVLTPFQLLV